MKKQTNLTSLKQVAAPTGSSYIVIMTVSNREFDAVCAHLIQPKPVSYLGPGGKQLPFSAKMGIFEDHTVIVICSFGGGDQRIAAAMAPALIKYSPSLAMFVGVGGGVSPEAAIGAVIIGSFVADFSKMREEPDGKVSHMMKGGPVHPSLVPLAHRVHAEGQWTKRIQTIAVESAADDSQEVFVGKISSGNMLILGDAGPGSRIIALAGSDTLAVDMESGACYELSTDYSVPFIPIRGISDRRNDKTLETDKRRQPLAAAHASAVAFEMIHLYIEPIPIEKNADYDRATSEGSDSSKQNDFPNEFEKTTEVKVSAPQPEKKDKVLKDKKVPASKINHSVGSEKPIESVLPEQYWKDINTMTRFGKLPKLYRGSTVNMQVRFEGIIEPCSESECDALGLEFGASVSQRFSFVKPDLNPSVFKLISKFNFLSKIYATNDTAEWLLDLDGSAVYSIVVRLEFGEAIVRQESAKSLLNDIYSWTMPDYEKPRETRKYFTGMILVSGSPI